MKVEPIRTFSPVTITLESPEEVELMWHILNRDSDETLDTYIARHYDRIDKKEYVRMKVELAESLGELRI